MLNFIKKACFYETKRYAKLMLLLFIDNFIEKFALSVGALTFFLFFFKNDIRLSTLYFILALYIIQFISYVFIRKKTYYINFETLSTTIGSFQLRLGEKLRRLPMGFFHKKSSAELLKIIVDDHNTVNMTWSGTLFLGTSIVVNLIVILLIMPFLNLPMTLLMFSIVPLSWIPMMITMKRYKKASKALKESSVETAKSLMDYVKGIATLRLFHMRDREFKRLFDGLEKNKKLVLEKELSAFPVSTFSASLLSMGIGILTIFGIYFLEKGFVSGMAFLIFIFVANQVYNPLITLYYLSLQLSDFRQAVYRIHEFYDYEEMTSGLEEKLPKNKEIYCENIGFGYQEKPILNSLSYKIVPKKMYALVGTSGCGKTTLLKLLLRYFEPNSGQIKFGKLNADEYNTETYLSAYAMVFQDAFIFNQSITYNIGIGRENASQEEIVNAAKQANCHEFITGLEKGYDTVVGVGGSKLSAGQRQRISIARAFLKDAPVILMDEPTASLDVENEFLMKESLKKLVKDKTVVIVSHRMQFIKDVDTILIMDQGKIVDGGSHNELIEKNSLYKKLWQEEQDVLSWQL